MTSILEEFLRFGEDTYQRRRSAEEGHTKRCLASSMISAIQNLRDDEGYSDHDFALAMQENLPRHLAHDYLNISELSDCLCPEVTADHEYSWEISFLHRDSEGGVGKSTQHLFCSLADAVREAEESRLYDPTISSAAVGRTIYEFGMSQGATAWFWMSTDYNRDVNSEDR